MDRQFTVCICHINPNDGGYAEIDFPAQPYALQDALDKVRFHEGEAPLISLDNCECDGMQQVLNYRTPEKDTLSDIYGLNALAGKMAEMDFLHVEIMSALVTREYSQSGISIGRIYDLACSMDQCHYIDASNDAGLGRFYAENGFLPELEDVSEEVFSKLDFKKIGQEMREAEKGMYLDNGLGYAVLEGEIQEQYSKLELTPKEPDYTILLEVSEVNSGEMELLKFPMESDAMDNILERYEAEGKANLSWRCADCAVPSLCDAVSTCESLTIINEAAYTMQSLEKYQLLTVKALFAASGVAGLEDAVEKMEAVDDVILCPGYSSPEDIGKDRLMTALDRKEAEMLIPFVNLYAYGQEVMRYCNMVMTEYGTIERRDGEPLMNQENKGPERGGMEMM